MASNRKKLTWGAVATALIAFTIQFVGEYAKMAISGDIPTAYPTVDVRTQWADIQELQATTNAITNQTLGITATPDTGQDPLQVLFEARLTEAAPDADLLLTYCENTRSEETFDCAAWVEATLADHAILIAQCQNASGDFSTCLTENDITLPGG